MILLLGFALTAALIAPDLLGSWETARAALPATFLEPAGDRGWPYLVSLFFAFLLGETFALVLGVVSVAIAVLLPKVLTLLLLTYHIRAPGIIVPILIGTLTEARSPALDRSVLAAMVAGPAATMVYRTSELAKRVDPAVFGVVVSLVAFGLVRVLLALRRDPGPKTDGA